MAGHASATSRSLSRDATLHALAPVEREAVGLDAVAEHDAARPSRARSVSASPAPSSARPSASCRWRGSATPRARRTRASSVVGAGSAQRRCQLAVDARRPAGRAGARWRRSARRTTGAPRAADARAVARGLVGAVADEDLVEREQLLPVVEARRAPSCAPRCAARPAATSAQQVGRRLRALVDEHAREALGSGLSPITGWPSRYLATLATSPSCPSTTTTSSRLEQEAVELGRAATVRGRHVGGIAPSTARAGRLVAQRGAPRPRRACARAASRKKRACSRVPWRASSSRVLASGARRARARGIISAAALRAAG